MADQTKKPDLGLLEEDDEFEEFPAEGLYNKHFHSNSYYVHQEYRLDEIFLVPLLKLSNLRDEKSISDSTK